MSHVVDPLGYIESLPPHERAAFIDSLSPDEVAFLDSLTATTSTAGTTWEPLPHQVPPTEDWWAWGIMGGRGSGKTRAGAEWLNEQAEGMPGSRWFIGAPTLGDARATCVEGESGLLAVNPRIKFNRGNYELRWPNGSYARCMGAYTPEDRERWRGPQWHGGWADEFGSWRQLDEVPNDDNPDVFHHMELSTRLGADPRVVITMTPRRRRRVKELIARSDVVFTHGTLHDNPYTSRRFRERILERFGGTRLARQEIEGRLLEDVLGALWTDDGIHQDRVIASAVPELWKVAVGVDPAGSVNGTTGIVPVGASVERWPHPQSGRPVRHGYVLGDYSEPGLSPEQWGARAVEAYHESEADYIAAEVNYGGDMVVSTIRAVDGTVPVRIVRASRGKVIRAEPISVLSKHHRLHFVGRMPELEEEATTFTEDAPWSPNRLDAMVWAATALFVGLTEGGRARVSSHRGVKMPTALGG